MGSWIRPEYDVVRRAQGSYAKALRRMSRRSFLSLAGTVAVGAVAAACAPSGGSSNTNSSIKGLNNVLNFFTTEDDPNTGAVFTSAAESFNATNPDWHVAPIMMSDNDLVERALAGLSAGEDLGIFEVQAAYRGSFADAGLLYPLDSLINKIGPDNFAVGTRVVSNGHDWVFPYGGGPYILWARSDRVPTFPTSFDDLRAVAAENTKGSNFGIALAIGDYGPVSETFPQFIWSQGGDYFDLQGNVTYGSNAVTAAIQNYVELVKYAPKGNTSWTYYDMISAYLSGRTAMSIYPGRLGADVVSMAPQLIKATSNGPLPAGPNPVQMWSWSYLAIAKNTKNPEIALKFLEYLFTGANGVAYANSVPGQLLPSNKTVRDASLADTTSPFVVQHKQWLTTLADQINNSTDSSGPMGAMASGKLQLYNGPPPPWSDVVFGINSVDSQMLANIVLKGMSIKDAQAGAVSQLKSIVSTYKQRHPSWKPPQG